MNKSLYAAVFGLPFFHYYRFIFPSQTWGGERIIKPLHERKTGHRRQNPGRSKP